MTNKMILEHVKEHSVPDQLDAREYGFYKATFEISPPESVGTALFASRDSVRKRTLNAELVEDVDDADPGDLPSYRNCDLAEALGWNPSAVTKVSQALDGITLIRVNDVMKSGARIFPLAPILKNYASRVLNLRPLHLTDTVLVMMDFIATDYHQEDPLYEHGLTLPLIELTYEAVEEPVGIFPEVRENGNSGYYEIVVQSSKTTADEIWDKIETQCKIYGKTIGSLATAGTDSSGWKTVVNKIQPQDCSCSGRCKHFAVHLLR